MLHPPVSSRGRPRYAKSVYLDPSTNDDGILDNVEKFKKSEILECMRGMLPPSDWNMEKAAEFRINHLKATHLPVESKIKSFPFAGFEKDGQITWTEDERNTEISISIGSFNVIDDKYDAIEKRFYAMVNDQRQYAVSAFPDRLVKKTVEKGGKKIVEVTYEFNSDKRKLLAGSNPFSSNQRKALDKMRDADLRGLSIIELKRPLNGELFDPRMKRRRVMGFQPRIKLVFNNRDVQNFENYMSVDGAHPADKLYKLLDVERPNGKRMEKLEEDAKKGVGMVPFNPEQIDDDTIDKVNSYLTDLKKEIAQEKEKIQEEVDNECKTWEEYFQGRRRRPNAMTHLKSERDVKIEFQKVVVRDDKVFGSNKLAIVKMGLWKKWQDFARMTSTMYENALKQAKMEEEVMHLIQTDDLKTVAVDNSKIMEEANEAYKLEREQRIAKETADNEKRVQFQRTQAKQRREEAEVQRQADLAEAEQKRKETEASEKLARELEAERQEAEAERTRKEEASKKLARELEAEQHRDREEEIRPKLPGGISIRSWEKREEAIRQQHPEEAARYEANKTLDLLARAEIERRNMTGFSKIDPDNVSAVQDIRSMFAQSLPYTIDRVKKFMETDVAKEVLKGLKQKYEDSWNLDTIVYKFESIVKRYIINDLRPGDMKTIYLQGERGYSDDTDTVALKSVLTMDAEELFANPKQTVSIVDLEEHFTPVDYGAGGDCGYYVLLAGLKYLYKAQQFDWDKSPLTKEIRELNYVSNADLAVKEGIVQQFRNNLAKLVDDNPALIPENVPNVKELLRDIRKMGEWIELGLLQHLIETTARVVLRVFMKIDNYTGYWESDPNIDDKRPAIHMYYIDRMHYKFLRPGVIYISSDEEDTDEDISPISEKSLRPTSTAYTDRTDTPRSLPSVSPVSSHVLGSTKLVKSPTSARSWTSEESVWTPKGEIPPTPRSVRGETGEYSSEKCENLFTEYTAWTDEDDTRSMNMDFMSEGHLNKHTNDYIRTEEGDDSPWMIVKVGRLVDYLKHNYAKNKDAWETMVQGAYKIMEVKKGEDAPEWFQPFAYEGDDTDPRKRTQLYNFEKAKKPKNATEIIDELLKSEVQGQGARMFVTPDTDKYRGAMFATRNSEGINELKYGTEVLKKLDETTHILTIDSLKTSNPEGQPGGKRAGQLILAMLYAECAMIDEFVILTPEVWRPALEEYYSTKYGMTWTQSIKLTQPPPEEQTPYVDVWQSRSTKKEDNGSDVGPSHPPFNVSAKALQWWFKRSIVDGTPLLDIVNEVRAVEADRSSVELTAYEPYPGYKRFCDTVRDKLMALTDYNGKKISLGNVKIKNYTSFIDFELELGEETLDKTAEDRQRDAEEVLAAKKLVLLGLGGRCYTETPIKDATLQWTPRAWKKYLNEIFGTQTIAQMTSVNLLAVRMSQKQHYNLDDRFVESVKKLTNNSSDTASTASTASTISSNATNRVTIEYESMSEDDIEEIEHAMRNYSRNLERYDSASEVGSTSNVADTAYGASSSDESTIKSVAYGASSSDESTIKSVAYGASSSDTESVASDVKMSTYDSSSDAVSDVKYDLGSDAESGSEVGSLANVRYDSSSDSDAVPARKMYDSSSDALSEKEMDYNSDATDDPQSDSNVSYQSESDSDMDTI